MAGAMEVTVQSERTDSINATGHPTPTAARPYPLLRHCDPEPRRATNGWRGISPNGEHPPRLEVTRSVHRRDTPSAQQPPEWKSSDSALSQLPGPRRSTPADAPVLYPPAPRLSSSTRNHRQHQMRRIASIMKNRLLRGLEFAIAPEVVTCIWIAVVAGKVA